METWPAHKWQSVAPHEGVQADLEAKFKAAGLPFIRFVNHVPEFDGDVEPGLPEAIAEGSLTQKVTFKNETIQEASPVVQSSAEKGKRPKKRKTKGGA